MNELVAKYATKADFIYMYVIDPHPKTDPSPYSGADWEPSNYSRYRQPRTYDERVAEAKAMRRGKPLSEQVAVFVDDLRPHNTTMKGDNPVWCRWGPAPNPGWLISPNGTVALAQAWFNATDMDAVLASMITEGKVADVSLPVQV